MTMWAILHRGVDVAGLGGSSFGARSGRAHSGFTDRDRRRKPQSLANPVRLVLVAVLSAVGVVLWAPPASAVVCIPNPDAANMRAAAADSDTELRLKANGLNLEVNGVSCGALATIDAVTVDMQAKSSGLVVFDLSGGPLGPGATDEGDGSSEIEFSVIGLSSSQGRIHVDGSSGNDAIAFGSATVNHISLNADADGATPDVDVTFGTVSALSADGKAGNDGISAAGVVNLLQPYNAPVTLTAGSGSNNLMGGSASDELRIQTESVSTGHDIVYGGGGVFDRVTISTQSSSLTSQFSLDDVANDGVGCPAQAVRGTTSAATSRKSRGRQRTRPSSDARATSTPWLATVATTSSTGSAALTHCSALAGRRSAVMTVTPSWCRPVASKRVEAPDATRRPWACAGCRVCHARRGRE